IGVFEIAASGTRCSGGFGGVVIAICLPVSFVLVAVPVAEATAGCSFFDSVLAAGGVVAPGSGRPGNSSVGADAEATFLSSFFAGGAGRSSPGSERPGGSAFLSFDATAAGGAGRAMPGRGGARAAGW